MWSEDVILMILNGVKETLYMTLASTILGYVLGLQWESAWQYQIKTV